MLHLCLLVSRLLMLVQHHLYAPRILFLCGKTMQFPRLVSTARCCVSAFSFYIILRGKVSIMVKEDGEQDDDSDDESGTRAHLLKPSLENKQEADRTKLGHFVGHLCKTKTT